MVDTNCSPENVEYVIPGNDDAMRAIQLYTSGIADAVLEGKESVPAVAVGEDEFVELDEQGNPRRKEGRGKPRPNANVRNRKAPPRRRPDAPAGAEAAAPVDVSDEAEDAIDAVAASVAVPAAGSGQRQPAPSGRWWGSASSP